MFFRTWTIATIALAATLTGASAAMAGEVVNDSVSFTVPAVGVPTAACVTINGNKTCNPNPATNPITATVSALVMEGNSLTFTEGAPATQASGENCDRLAKTVHVVLGAGAQASVNVIGTEPAISETVSGPPVPGELTSNEIELCVNG